VPALLRKTISVLALLAFASLSALAQSPSGTKLLPEKVGDFTASGKLTLPDPALHYSAEDFQVAETAGQIYAAPDGRKFAVVVIKTNSSSAAYSLLVHFARGPIGPLEGIGALGIATPPGISYVKGANLVTVEGVGEAAGTAESPRAFAKAFADTLEGEAGELPVLVLHLPEWEKKVREGVGYAVTPGALKLAAGSQPALDAVPFDGGTEAVTATYGNARLVIVEFPTPQHSVDADAAINNRINELRASGQPTPSGYKRVGNYSVFVYGAADEGAAGQLLSGVKYEKDVRWLGRNPHAEEIATRHYTSTMGGVLVTTLITTGLAILLCLGVGAVVGGAVFLRRRAKQAEEEVYTDAGGMLRLNIEDLNTPPPSTNLLRQGED
jgi:hypothetical protein